MAATLQYFLSGFLCVALLAKIAELRLKRLRDPRTTMLTVALGSFTVAALAGIPVVRRNVPFETVPGVASLTMDTGVSVSLALLTAYLWRPLRRTRSGPWWRGRLLLAAGAVSALLAVLMAATPPARRTDPLQNEYTGDWKIVGVYLIGNLFFLFCSAASAIACLRIARIVRDHVALGVRVGAIGMVAYAVTCVNRLALVVAQLLSADAWFTWYSVVNFVFTEAAVLASVLGLHFTALWRAVGGVHRAYDDLRAFWRIGPAWRRLTTLHPEVVLPRERGLRGLGDLIDISYRRYRREIECQDALLLLSGAPTDARPPGGPPGDDDPPTALGVPHGSARKVL
ncbi:MAB_1171c family putative transporter [Streptomyces sp. NPDC002766]|uniref:MAB_1171c family putative transporter n=1 Tax=Streptomyces sp. NPDC002766 TaxID=3154429 RepID=UPI00332BE374